MIILIQNITFILLLKEMILIHNADKAGRALRELSIRLRNETGDFRNASDIMNDLADRWDKLSQNSPVYSIEDEDYQKSCVHCSDCKYSHVIRSDYDVVSCDKDRCATIYSKHPCSDFVLAEVTESCNSCKHMDVIYGNDGDIGITNYGCDKKDGKHALMKCNEYCRKMYVEYFK